MLVSTCKEPQESQMMKQSSRFRLRNKSCFYLNFSHNQEMIMFLTEQLFLQLFQYLLHRYVIKQSSVARSVLFIVVKQKIQSTILGSCETALYYFIFLLSAEISRLSRSSSQQRFASAHPLLVLARLLGHKISWEFFLVRKARSLQLSLTGGLRALFCCYCVYVLLRGALVYIKP